MLRYRGLSAGLVLMFFLSLAPAFADQVTFVNPGTLVMGGVYAGPYVIDVNGRNITVICDDAVNEVYYGESWTGKQTSLPSLTGVKWRGITFGTGFFSPGSAALTLTQSQEYHAIEYLARDILGRRSNPTKEAEAQWALWDLTATLTRTGPPMATGLLNFSNGSEPFGSVCSGLTTTQCSARMSQIETDMQNAIRAATRGGYNGSSLAIYTPASVGMCGGTPCPDPTPQEYVQVTPEPASLTLMGSGLLGLAACLRKKKIFG